MKLNYKETNVTIWWLQRIKSEWIFQLSIIVLLQISTLYVSSMFLLSSIGTEMQLIVPEK